MKYSGVLATLLASTLITSAAVGDAFPSWKAPGKNIARGKPYAFIGSPSLNETKDEGDAVQLTDGVYVPTDKFMWFYKEALAWPRPKPNRVSGVIIDLGQVQTIGGMSFSTDSGSHAAITYPGAILVFVSEDGEQYRLAGELVALAAKYGAPPEMGRHRFVTDDLCARGRYVQILFQVSNATVCDEIEIYAAAKGVTPVEGVVVAKPRDFANSNAIAMGYAVAARIAQDAVRAREQIAKLGLPAASLKTYETTLAKVLATAASGPVKIVADASAAATATAEVPLDLMRYRALIPLDDNHATIFATLAKALREAGKPEFAVWPVNRWTRQSPFTAIEAMPTETSEGVSQHMMQNERRGATFNIANFSDKATTATIRFEGLPGGAKPAFMDVRQVEYVTLQGRSFWEADALPRAEVTDAGWVVTLPAGVVRQVWIDFRLDQAECPAGIYDANVKIAIAGGKEQTLPLSLNVAASKMPGPRDRALGVGLWDYIHGNGYGLARGENMDACIAQLQDNGLNAPWAQAGRNHAIFPRYDAKFFDENGKMVAEPSYEEFDKWVAKWPNAKYYMIYAGAWGGLNDPGSEKFAATMEKLDETQVRFGEVMKKWAAHMRARNIDPSRIMLCIMDEPGYSSAARTILYWGRAIRAAVPEFKLFTDPVYRPDAYENELVFQMLTMHDIVAPSPDWSYHRRGQAAYDFYEKIRQAGSAIGFYTCSQGIGGTEATKYYRTSGWEAWVANKGTAPDSYIGFWAYGDNRGSIPWAQLMGGSDLNFVPLYIDATSATDGKHFVAIFEGAQDYEYLKILKNAIEEAIKKGKAGEAIEAAESLLATLPQAVLDAVRAGEPALHTGDVNLPWNSGDMNACDTGRVKVLEALASLE